MTHTQVLVCERLQSTRTWDLCLSYHRHLIPSSPLIPQFLCYNKNSLNLIRKQSCMDTSRTVPVRPSYITSLQETCESRNGPRSPLDLSGLKSQFQVSVTPWPETLPDLCFLQGIHICGCRYNERLKAKTEGSTSLTYTGLCGGLGHLKIETRFRDESFERVMGECVI